MCLPSYRHKAFPTQISRKLLIIQDWLADQYYVQPRMSEHWVRCGRLYVKNNAFPSLADMMERIRFGRRTTLQVMYSLQNRGVIRPDFDTC